MNEQLGWAIFMFAAGALIKISDRVSHAISGPDKTVSTFGQYLRQHAVRLPGAILTAIVVFVLLREAGELTTKLSAVLAGYGIQDAADSILTRGKRAVTAVATIFLALVIAACPAAIRNDPATRKPYREPTVGEQMLALNVMLAQTNLSVQRGVVQAHALGLLPVGVAGDVIRATKRVAELDNDLLPLLAAAAEGAGDLPTLRARLKEITDELVKVQVMNGLGIKNPESQRTFAAEALLLQSLADQILALVERLQGAWNEIPFAHHAGHEFARHDHRGIGGAGGALEAAARA